MNNTIEYISKQDELSFLTELLNVVCETNNDIDLSIIVNSELAEYIIEYLDYKEEICVTKNDFEHDFGELTGFALVTIIKDGGQVNVIAEDLSYLNAQNIVDYKYHEADTLLLFEGKKNIDIEKIIEIYEPNKTILVSLEDETNEINKLLFS